MTACGIGELTPTSEVVLQANASEPSESPTTETALAPTTEATTEATIDPTTAPTEEPATEATTEPTTAPTKNPATEAPTEPKGTTYILNTNSKKFHYTTCSSVDTIKETNKKVFTGTKSELLAMGYEPCGRCKP